MPHLCEIDRLARHVNNGRGRDHALRNRSEYLHQVIRLDIAVDAHHDITEDDST